MDAVPYQGERAGLLLALGVGALVAVGLAVANVVVVLGSDAYDGSWLLAGVSVYVLLFLGAPILLLAPLSLFEARRTRRAMARAFTKGPNAWLRWAAILLPLAVIVPFLWLIPGVDDGGPVPLDVVAGTSWWLTLWMLLGGFVAWAFGILGARAEAIEGQATVPEHATPTEEPET